MAKKIKARYFDKSYWVDGTKSGYDIHSFYRGDHLHQAKALMLNEVYNPKKPLIAGCARGWVVEELRKLGADAHGFDISKWAIKNSPPIIFDADRLKASSGLKPKLYQPGSFDLIATFEVVEHIQEDDVGVWFGNLFKWLKPGGKLFATICLGHNNTRGMDDNDKSHQTLQPRDWWDDLICSEGFEWDQESFEKSKITEVETKERLINIIGEMGWHVFAYTKPGVA